VDGICTRFLRKGLIKPNKTQMTAAVWSNDARWLALGTQTGDLARWEGDTLKVQKLVSVSAHKTLFDGDRVKEAFAITSMAWDKASNLLVTADARGTMQYCDETFRNVLVISEAHSGAIRGLSFSPSGSKLVSAGDDSALHIWGVGQDKPERTLSGHQSDVKSVDWHPYRALIASASRDATMRLWDPRQEAPVRYEVLAHITSARARYDTKIGSALFEHTPYCSHLISHNLQNLTNHVPTHVLYHKPSHPHIHAHIHTQHAHTHILIYLALYMATRNKSTPARGTR
jgi:WD40 repeat protein